MHLFQYTWSKNVEFFLFHYPTKLYKHSLHVLFCNLTSDEKQEDGIIVKNGSSTFAVTTILQDYQGPHLTVGTMVNGNGHTKEMSAHNKLDAEFPINKEVTIVDTISQDGTFMSSSLSDCCNHPNVNVISESPMGRANSPSLLCNRVEGLSPLIRYGVTCVVTQQL